jgi:hypothetical protein
MKKMKKERPAAAAAIPVVLVLQLFLFQACFASGQPDNRHYIHALESLRLASGYLDTFTPSEQLNQKLINTVTEIAEAVREIKLDGFDDGKGMSDHPVIDRYMKKADRYREAAALLDEISRVLNPEKTGGAPPRIAGHISSASRDMEDIMRIAGFSGNHPSYLHALTDMRLVRTYLDRITPDIGIDNNELNAIGEVNEAMKEIDMAAIDDAKDLMKDPSPDVDPDNTGRFNKAVELLDKVFNDIKSEESNGFALSAQKRALRHIENARDIVLRMIK